MTEYVAFDFETANAGRASACALGAVRVRNGEIIDRLDVLVNPETHFDWMNVRIHGIDADAVAGAATFPEVYADFVAFTDGAEAIVGHSAAFDVQVLRQSAARYHVSLIEQPFACTRVFARRWWGGWPSYSLRYVYERLALGAVDGHHQALWDATACASIAEAGLTANGYGSWADAAADAGVRLGTIRAADYYGCVSPSEGAGSYNPIHPRAAEPGTVDESHPLFGVAVTFTGALAHYTRRDAAQIVTDLGGIFAASVSGKTNLLVVGEQDLAMLAGHNVSSKMRKAIDLAAQGKPIEVIDEAEFYNLL
jgi:DNA polymerase-3 subunit epsilon